MYPYGLAQNPYPSSPTPTLIDAQVLGGRRHKEAKNAVISCIDDLYYKVSGIATDKDFRLITLIQDVGSGKTHLALHIRGLHKICNNAVISYVDLSQVFPRDIYSLYGAMLRGLDKEYIDSLRKAIVCYLKDKAEQNNKQAKKFFNYGIVDYIRRKSLSNKAEEILDGTMVPDFSEMNQVLKGDFSASELYIMKLIIRGKFRDDAYNVKNMENIITSISAMANLNLKFLKKLTILQIDEFDSDKKSLDFVKAVINAHLPSTVLMLILTPSSYEAIRKEDSSIFDRLEKANYKIDLAGSNTLEEILDIILEYVRHYDLQRCFKVQDENELSAKIKVIYDEFPDFRNVRSMTNILYHATENAAKRNARIIDEKAIDDTIKSTHPGLRIRGSIMGVPLSDFIKIRSSSNDIQMLESDVRDAVKNLLNYAHDMGSVAQFEATNGRASGIDVIYNDTSGTKVAVAVVINKDHTKNFDQISNTVKSVGFADKLLILTNANTNSGTDRTTVVNIDRCKMTDLIYFSSKYKNNEILNDDLNRALMLAKSIKLC
ncbi:MAG TPA: hypothetical protein VFY41_07010 [Nitrososphaeraceae archaeon]|nr:hypothetical protein [Nitrososphaeraceae archaeon]